MAKRAKWKGATFAATVIVDPPEFGGEVRLLIDGRVYMLRGRIVRGLRELTITDGGVPNLYADGVV